MPSIETRDRKQKAVLWERAGADAYSEPKVNAPDEINVRWKWDSRSTTDAQGNVITTAATVVVNQTIAVGSLMWLGELADWYGTGSAGTDDLVMEVVDYRETPDLKNRHRRRTVTLAFFRDTMPAQV